MKKFSLNRVLGITKVKRAIAKHSGIPTTKQGRKKKAQGCLWKLLFRG